MYFDLRNNVCWCLFILSLVMCVGVDVYLYFPGTQILSLMESVHQAQQHVQQLWQHKKMKLDQCFQLRLFEQDVEKVKGYSGLLFMFASI